MSGLTVERAKEIWTEEMKAVSWPCKAKKKCSIKSWAFPDEETFSMQSAVIKMGTMIEKIYNQWAKESAKTKHHVHPNLEIPGEKKKKQIDLTYNWKYCEMKGNVDFDTEKNPAVLEKIKLVAEHLSKESGHKIKGFLLIPTLWETKGYKYFKKGQKEIAIGVTDFLSDIGLEMSLEEYRGLWEMTGDYAKEQAK